MACDGAGNLFVADSGNRTIRKIVVATGVVTTLAGSPGKPGDTDGTADAARFNFPIGVAYDSAGNLFVADSKNHTIRQVVIATGVVSTLAGAPETAGSTDGRGSAAQFNAPTWIASDSAGSLFVADTGNRTIRKVEIATAMVTTVAGSPGMLGCGDGMGTSAWFTRPLGLGIDGAGSLFVVDEDCHVIRSIVIATGGVTTLAGSGVMGSRDGPRDAAEFGYAKGVAADGAGNLFVTDGVAIENLDYTGSHAIRKLAIASGVVSTFAGAPPAPGSADGTGSAARFDYPGGLAIDGAGNLFVSDGANHTIRKVVLATAEVTTLAGSAGSVGSSDGIGNAARFSWPRGAGCRSGRQPLCC